jgi:hypothetical protein
MIENGISTKGTYRDNMRLSDWSRINYSWIVMF